MGSVSKLTPFDTTGVKDVGVRAIISLAVSLGWNVVLKPHNPCTLIAKDGARLRVPTDTSVNDGVFQGYLSTIMSHSVEHTPTVELMDSVIAVNKKLSESHQRRLRLAVGETAKQHRERMNAYKEGAREMAQGDHLTQRIEIPKIDPMPLTDAEWKPFAEAVGIEEPTQPVGKPEIVSEKPFTARAQRGWSYPSPGVLERIWSDGHKDYRCVSCPYTGKTPAAIGGHRKIHRLPKPDVPAEVANRVREDVPPTIIHKPKEAPVPDQQAVEALVSTHPAKILDQIRYLVAQPLVQSNSDLAAENAQLRAENKKLKDDWAALQSLLNPGRQT